MIATLLAVALSLDGAWHLTYWPEPATGAVRSLPLPAALVTEEVAAAVPGNCELDLVRAGRLPPLEVGLNIRLLRPYEGYQWLYTRSFDAPTIPQDGSRASLVFEGIDTLADVFLNGEKIGEADNMLIAQRFDVTRRLKPGRNTVQVLLRSVLLAAQHESVGEMGYSQATGDHADGERFRKPAHAGGWDISPRAFVAGLWRPVRLDVEPPVRIDETAWFASNIRFSERKARIDVRCRVQAPFTTLDHATLRMSLSRDGVQVLDDRTPLISYQNARTFESVENLAFWWPHGFGEQPLYDATIEVIDEAGKVLAQRTEKFGVRTITLEQADIVSAEQPGQFLFRVNGEPCYMRGSNWVPLDALHSRDNESLVATLEMFKDLNCNMIRVWGGGVYESDAFFDWCDREGLLVWQDFMTGCSVYPQDDDFARRFAAEVKCVILRLRNHASLALWAGGNENDQAMRWRTPREFWRDPNDDRLSREIIPRLLFDLDVSRPYLPGSPYLSREVAAGRAQSPEDHLWGAREAYKVDYYTNSPAWFVSEMGYHGCPNVNSLKRMMTPEAVYPWSKITGTDPQRDYVWNDEWVLKASDPFFTGGFGQRRNSLMTNQAKLVFGEVPTNLTDFVEASQIVQEQAMKTFCELFRTRKFTRCNGLIWWNVRDCWPQISDAVVDYYGGKKRAYHALKTAQQNQIVCVVDDHTAWAVNDERRPIEGSVTIRDRASGRVVFARDAFTIPANGKLALGIVPFEGQGLLIIEAKLDGRPFKNNYLYGQPPFDLNEVRRWLGNDSRD